MSRKSDPTKHHSTAYLETSPIGETITATAYPNIRNPSLMRLSLSQRISSSSTSRPTGLSLHHPPGTAIQCHHLRPTHTTPPNPPKTIHTPLKTIQLKARTHISQARSPFKLPVDARRRHSTSQTPNPARPGNSSPARDSLQGAAGPGVGDMSASFDEFQ